MCWDRTRSKLSPHVIHANLTAGSFVQFLFIRPKQPRYQLSQTTVTYVSFKLDSNRRPFWTPHGCVFASVCTTWVQPASSRIFLFPSVLYSVVLPWNFASHSVWTHSHTLEISLHSHRRHYTTASTGWVTLQWQVNWSSHVKWLEFPFKSKYNYRRMLSTVHLKVNKIWETIFLYCHNDE